MERVWVFSVRRSCQRWKWLVNSGATDGTFVQNVLEELGISGTSAWGGI
ncbi:MAG: hypothetical protein AB1487_12575 [Thermodesulfobacteriota bacterium]